MKYARTFAIAAAILALGATVSSAEARGGGHGGSLTWGEALAGAAVRGIAEGLAESATTPAYAAAPAYGYTTPAYATPAYGSPYGYTSSYYGYVPTPAPPPVYYPTVVASAPGVTTPAYVLMPASASPYLAMGVKLTPELIYGLTGANAVAPVYQPYYGPTRPSPPQPTPAGYQSQTVSVN
jgi:hypothetical protein